MAQVAVIENKVGSIVGTGSHNDVIEAVCPSLYTNVQWDMQLAIRAVASPYTLTPFIQGLSGFSAAYNTIDSTEGGVYIGGSYVGWGYTLSAFCKFNESGNSYVNTWCYGDEEACAMQVCVRNVYCQQTYNSGTNTFNSKSDSGTARAKAWVPDGKQMVASLNPMRSNRSNPGQATAPNGYVFDIFVGRPASRSNPPAWPTVYNATKVAEYRGTNLWVCIIGRESDGTPAPATGFNEGMAYAVTSISARAAGDNPMKFGVS
jgi:hypothetical protein